MVLDRLLELGSTPVAPGLPATPVRIVAAVFVLAFGIWLARLLRRVVLDVVRRWDEAEDTWLPRIAHWVHTLAVTLAVAGALQAAGLLDFGSALVVLHLVLNFPLFHLSGESVTLVTLLTFLAILAATWSTSRVLQRAVARQLRQRNVESAGTIAAITRLAHYFVMLLGLGVGLQIIGIDLAALFTAGAVFAVGLGFAMQNIAQNFVSGVILLLERAIKPGDVLEVDGRTVRVVQMGIRATIARTRDDEDIIIPNATLVQGTVKNFTLLDPVIRVRATVGVTYGSDMRRVLAVLRAVAEACPDADPDRSPVVQLLGFGDSSVDWEVSVWVRDPWATPRVRSDLYQAMWFALQEAELVIAFPQLDLHLDPPVVESLKALERR